LSFSVVSFNYIKTNIYFIHTIWSTS